MLWVYGHYKYVYSYKAGIDFSRQNCRRQILSTKVDPRSVRVNPRRAKNQPGQQYGDDGIQ